MFFRTRHRLVTLETRSLLEQALIAHKPKFIQGTFSGDGWRHKSMARTLKIIQYQEHMDFLTAQAHSNMQRWQKNAYSSPKSVQVVHEDWGQVTKKASQEFGTIYTVLNLANPYFPGGACFSGGSAQEENMWHRSNCALSLLEPGVVFDESSKSFVYQDILKNLVQGKQKMSLMELEQLRQRCPDLNVDVSYKVMLADKLRICFRGPEIFLNSTPEQFQAKDYISDEFNSFVMLPSEEVFPFYELRSAAPQFVSPQSLTIAYLRDLRQRIQAQLDTLILYNHTHVVLGAWGCGAFKNNPKIVARLYREEIEKRAAFFHHILFPIISLGSHNSNYAIFKDNLEGLSLGNNKHSFSLL